MSKPYTVRFGPWLPDLQDVGVEMPFQWSATELPVADCLNVYWQDAAYRCLPAPAAFGPSLGTLILDAFSWYDNTQGKEIVFAATASGFYQLEDGVWNQIPVQVNASAGTVGLALSVKLGAPFATAVYLTPSAQSDRGSATSYIFSSVSANAGNGSVTSYNWTFSGQTGSGTWSVESGQGSSVAVPQVTGVTAGTTSTATFSCAQTINGVVYSSSSSLSYTASAPPPLLHQYNSGSGVETVPSGYNNVVIEVWGGNGGGASAGPEEIHSGIVYYYGGGGGGAGGYARTSIAVASGQTFNWAIGRGGAGGPGETQYAAGSAGAASTVSGATITTMTANGGGGAPGAGGGSGGSATGGNQANDTGSNGEGGGENVAGQGGVPQTGEYGAASGNGGNGGLTLNQNGNPGAAGAVSFYYTLS